MKQKVTNAKTVQRAGINISGEMVQEHIQNVEREG